MKTLTRREHNVSLIYTILLGIAAALVSGIGATFSVTGLAKLFSGAPNSVMFMAAALEFAKLVSAGFLHQNWHALGLGLRVYLSTAVLALIGITSLGIFGYLSHAYQKSSTSIKSVQFKIENLQKEDTKVHDDIARIQRSLDEVPKNRVSKRIELQKEFEPEIQRLKKRQFEINLALQGLLVERQSYQTEIGPLSFVAEAFNISMDGISRWLILLFVCVFDPLAVCLVFAVSWSLKQYRKEQAAKGLAPLINQAPITTDPQPTSSTASVDAA